MEKNFFNKLCYLTQNFLRKRPSKNNLGNPFLFIVSGHPFHLKKYKSINSKKINLLYLLKFIFELTLNLIKIKLYVLKLVCTKNYSKINKNFVKGSIVISHLINYDNFKKGIDIQYSGIEKKNKNINKIFFYLNHMKKLNNNKFSRKKLIDLRRNVFINNDCIELSQYKKILKSVIKDFILLINTAKQIENRFEKKFLLECAKHLLSLSTIKNVILYYNIEKLLIKKKIKSILITFEGHPYEYLICLLGKKYNIKIFAYQHGPITKNHFSMFLNIGNKFLPTNIMASGRISYDILRKNINPKKVILLGSERYTKSVKIRKNNKNLNFLILPAGFENEANDLFRLCYNFLKKEKKYNIKFIFRLHPQLDKLRFIKKNIKILQNEKRIIISNSKLKDDISSCKFAIYRASTAIVEAMQYGLIPIFFHDIGNNFQSDVLWKLKSRAIIKSPNELSRIFIKNFKKKEISKYIIYANNFYQPVNYNKLKKIF